MMRKSILLLVGVLSISALAGDISFTNDLAVMTFDWAGRIKTLRERATGRELVKSPVPFLVAGAGRCVYPNGFSAVGGDEYCWHTKQGNIRMSIRSFGGGWTFEVTACTIPNAVYLYFGWVEPECRTFKGYVLNMLSDEQSGVVVRSYDPEGGASIRDGKAIFVHVDKPHAFVGRRCGIVAAPRKDLSTALKQMTEAAGAFHTQSSGAWSLGAEENRGSYLFTEMSPGSAQDWIDLAKRGGFDTIHFANAGSRGHFLMSKALYPRGYDDFKYCADLAHAAGFRVSMHTLTGCINPQDSWITPICRTDLISRCSHTLAQPLSETDTEMLVTEKPEAHHDTVHTYSSHGNTFRIGTELVQYTGIRREKPYAFTGIVRGAFGTNKGGTYPAGTQAEYLLQAYDAFYPKPYSPLVSELGDQIAKAFETGKVDQIYFDGSEGISPRFAMDAVRGALAPRLGDKALIEGSCCNAGGWWYFSRYGAWDPSLWGAKLFQDQHVRDLERIRLSDLIEPQAGWWAPRQASNHARGHFLDEMEYYAAKNAAHDMASSLEHVDMRRQPITPFTITRQMTVHGWYERMRLARAFTPNALDLFVQQGVDVKLRQGTNGLWMCQRADALGWRFANGSRERTCGNLAADSTPKEVAVRIEALYGASETNTPKILLAPADTFTLTQATTPAMHAQLKKEVTEKGEALILSAQNGGNTMQGSWAAFGWQGAAPYRDAKDLGAFRFWVKGDGKGETLCFQLSSAREFSEGVSDHYITIDFTGWRQVTVLLRERDVARMEEFTWPHSNRHNMLFVTSPLNAKYISKMAFLLNNVKSGEDVQVAVTAVEALPLVKTILTGASFEVDEEKVTVPFSLTSGDYAELEDGFWTHYAEDGTPLSRKAGPRIQAKGTIHNFKSASNARAEITCFRLGAPLVATHNLANLEAAARKRVQYEAEMPVWYAPKSGFAGSFTVKIRPHEKAHLEWRLTGACENPTLRGAGGEWIFPVKMTAQDRLFCRDGRHWCVLRKKRLDMLETIAEGDLPNTFPQLDKTTTFTITSSKPDGAALEVDAIKHYGK